MKLHVICEKDGTIASLHSGVVSGPHAAISAAGVDPRPGQTLHTVRVTDDMRALSLSDIHRQFKLQVSKGAISLVRPSPSAKSARKKR